MFESLFGPEMPLAIRFFLAFLIVLGLIGATAWAVRRFGSGRLGGAGTRGRQPRLAVIDHASVDARRRLILVRRDNIEHLIMIGGPTDVVVESNIVRAAPAAREVAPPRPQAVPESLPRAIPLPDSASNGSWPLQPEPMTPSRPVPRIEAIPEEPPQRPEPPRPQRETLAALADEIATRPVPPLPPRGRPAAPIRSRPIEPRAEPRAEPRTEPREPRAEPREPRAEPRMPAEPEPLAAADQSLAEMAHRLEAALRKPKSGAAPAPGARVAPPAEDAPPAQPAPQSRPAPGAAKPGQGKALYDSLEQEMASLLGRPAGKT
jgi:flagellar protein FliO/FliZ